MATPPNSEELIVEFCDLTQCSPSEARTTLEQADWDYKTAVQLWYASLEEAPEEPDDMEEDDPQPIPSTSGASGSGPSAGASSSRQARQGGGFRTLQDLTSGDGHDQADDDDHSDNDYFTGGEKSGLAVHGGNRDPQDHIQSLLDRARRNLPRPGGEEDDNPQSHFTGRGVTLGGDDAPSRIIDDANTNTTQPAARVQRTLHLWEDGFSVDDGPLYRYDDPANEETLNMIHSGRAPLHLLNVQPGQEVDLGLDVQKDKPYVKPKPTYKPFSGQGHRLGSPTPGPSSAPPSAPIPAAPSASASAAASTPSEMTIDDAQPTVTLQIRLGDGTRLTSRFNTSHTIGDVYGFVDRASTASGERPYALMTTFPSKELDDRDAVIGDLSEFKRGGVVVQKWK